MTDRISHEEARGTVDILADTTTPAFQLESAREGLLAYITQQQAAETDTVTRAEHRAVLDRVLRQRESEHGARVAALRAEHEAALEAAGEMFMTQAREQLTALQAEHEAVVNRWSLRLSSEQASCMKLLERLATERDAAQARVAELEAALCELERVFRLGSMVGCRPADDALAEAREVLGTASLPPAVSAQAGRVQPSPFQQVAEASVQRAEFHAMAERAGEPTASVMASAAPADQPRDDEPIIRPAVAYYEPGQREEPDYVTRGELVVALRELVGPERYLPMEKFLLNQLADALEKARER